MEEPLKLTERQKDFLKNYECISCSRRSDMIDICASYPGLPCKQSVRNEDTITILKKHGLWPENSNYKMLKDIL